MGGQRTRDLDAVKNAAALSLAPLTIGLARFGYAVLLPAMRTNLHWTFAQAGALNTGNGLGYLAGALLTPVVARGLGERRAFLLSFAVVAGGLAASACTVDYALLLAARTLAGIAIAVLYVVGATMAARVADESSSPALVLGLYFAGVGPGILISSALAPLVLGSPAGWRAAWLVMAGATAMSAIVAARASRQVRGGPGAPGHSRRLGPIVWAMAAFTLYGLGYSSYMTFIVAYYVASGRSATAVALFWALLAVAATASGLAWRTALDRLPGGGGLALSTLTVALGSALPLVSPSGALMIVSALLFGGAFLAVSTALAQVVRRTLTPASRAAGLGLSTALFAAGQAAGPLVTGIAADRTGHLASGLALSTLCLALGALAALRQPSAAVGAAAGSGPARREEGTT